MKIGLMGGTFDPIHVGHLRAAENARESLELDRLYFVPVSVPPHRADPVSSALDRYAMVALATSTNSVFAASDVEIQRDGPSYTVDTVATIRSQSREDDLYLIVGSDTFPEVRTWKDHARLLEMCRVAVVHRPGQLRPADMPDIPAERVCWVEGAGLPISATDIRRRMREGHSVRYLVPEVVADYIAKRGLYR